ncbi:MAG TPA: ChbG/HpnK family deacetylase [Xanthobacteraceae bacterium]|nr:ChbG/HpnK family deacetylase [Xanthobacteraceae bacterium]
MTDMPRRIWLCADDYGIAPGVNAAIRDLTAQGRLNATSAMVVAPSLDAEAAQALAALNAGAKQIAIGLHLTMTAPFRPLSQGFAPLDEGAFLPIGAMLLRGLARRLDPVTAAREIDAQLAAFAKLFGRMPDFIDGHQHVHLLPGIREPLLAAMARQAPHAWVRQCGRAGRGRGYGRFAFADRKALLLDALSAGFRKRAEAAGIRTNTGFGGAYDFVETADFAMLFPRFLDGLPDGGLIMCHPGMVDAELMRLDPLTTLRQREYDYFRGDAFPAALRGRDIALRPAAA